MTDQTAGPPATDRLLAYVADLELEVDRLRRQGAYLERTAVDALSQILRLSTSPATGDPPPALAEVEATARSLLGVVKDLHDSPGYHPAHDQVVAVAVRPLAERTFRWQKRLTGGTGVDLRLELEIDHLEWFPARLRHILDNLFAHALRFRDPSAGDPWVCLGVRAADGRYEVRVSYNGVGPPPGDDRRVLDLFYRAAPFRTAEMGVGLSVVKLLVEQSGGTLTAAPRPDRGTDFILSLPRYDLLDYLE